MNQRIKELANEAYVLTNEYCEIANLDQVDDYKRFRQEIYMQKFSDLIVKECIEQVSYIGTIGIYDLPPNEHLDHRDVTKAIVKGLIKHFGEEK